MPYSKGDDDYEDQSKCAKLFLDFYIGRGRDNPPMTTRMTQMEDFKYVTTEKFEKVDKLLDKLIWFGATIAVAVIGTLAKSIFHL
jgi:hypothetical protein